jgi:7-cyano-7-deazaguanine synthase in queuosine biosynthesis
MREEYWISGTAAHLHIAGAVQQSAKLDADGFFQTLLTLPRHRSLDLLRIGAGIYFVDRIAKRKKGLGDEHGVRQLHLVVEVHDVGFWRRRYVKNLLAEILWFLTNENWSFHFEKQKRAPADLGHQSFLNLSRPFAPRNIALYSGGLDSAAGLAKRFLEGSDQFLLVTVGHQSGMHRRAQTQLNSLADLFQGYHGHTVQFLHSTLTGSLHGGKSKRMRQQERTQRSRAFLFCTAAAIAAREYGLERVEMFENGVGSINLPLMTGMLSGGLSTRGAHPTFLRLMSELCGEVMGSAIRFVLPFESRTKAEMLMGLKRFPELSVWAQASRSCVHTSLREVGKTHCGRCPGCIERRQAFSAAGIGEDLKIYQTDVRTEELHREDEAGYLSLYKLEAMHWLEGAERSRRRLANHLRLTDVPPEQDDRIRELQLRHSLEVYGTFGSPFLTEGKSTALSTPGSVSV